MVANTKCDNPFFSSPQSYIHYVSWLSRSFLYIFVQYTLYYLNCRILRSIIVENANKWTMVSLKKKTGAKSLSFIVALKGIYAHSAHNKTAKLIHFQHTNYKWFIDWIEHFYGTVSADLWPINFRFVFTRFEGVHSRTWFNYK